jgi:hypothetical protein
MWVEWSVGGAADLAKRNPEPPTGGEAYTDLLCAVGFAFIKQALTLLFSSERKGIWTAAGTR